MKRTKIYLTLALLLATATGSWAQTHNVIFANGVDTEGWTISPTEAAEDETVTVSYTGPHKVKSVTVKGIVGKSDFSTGYTNATSKAYQLNEGEMATFTFVNHTDKAANWNNFIAWVKNSADANLRLLRGDAWDDVLNSNAGIISNFDWNTFLNDIDGATVVVTFKYYNGKVSIHADVTTTDSRKFYETASVDASGTVSVCMTIGNGCYLSDVTSQKSAYNTNIIGEVDNSNVYQGVRTQKVAIERGQTVTYSFTNYTSKGGNWTNFVAAASDETGTIMLLRADAWDNIQNGNNGITNNFNWTTFQDDMDGASVVLTYTYKSNGQLITRADITTTSNHSYYEEYEFTRAALGTLTTWVTLELSHLVLSNVTTGTAPTIPSLNIINPVVKQVIGSDGRNYDYDNLPPGVNAEAMIWYVNGNNGLALAMADEDVNKLVWSSAITTAAAHIAPFTGGTWKLPTRAEWTNMVIDVSHSVELRDGFSSVGGTNLQADLYWSATERSSDTSRAECYWFNGQSGWMHGPKTNHYYVRACLVF